MSPCNFDVARQASLEIEIACFSVKVRLNFCKAATLCSWLRLSEMHVGSDHNVCMAETDWLAGCHVGTQLRHGVLHRAALSLFNDVV